MTEKAAVNRFGEDRPERTGFSSAAGSALNSPTATTLANNEIFRPHERSENGFGQGVGWGGRRHS